MEDPVEQWEIEEYYSSSSGEEGCKSTVSWILNRGLQLGKKVVITGVVISSAPLVLPLVVVSALGFAISVPFGVVFASYACTEKLMNKLLPMPASSPQLEYETGLMDDAEEEESEFGGEFLQEEELEKQIVDTKEEDEMRVKLVEDAKKEQQERHVVGDNGLKDIEEVVQEKIYKIENFKEKGYDEDVDEYLEGKDEGSLVGVNIKIEGEVDTESIEESKNEKLVISPVVKRAVIVTAGNKKNGNDVTKTDELVVVARVVQPDIRDAEKVTSNKEEKELKEGTTGLLVKIRDESEVGESVKKNKKKNKHHGKKSHGIGKNKEDKHGKSTKEMNENLNKQLGEKGEETILDAKKGSKKVTAEGSRTENIVADDRSSAGHQETLSNGKHAAKNCKTVEVELNPGEVMQGSRVDSNVSDEKEVNSILSKEERSETDSTPEKSTTEKNFRVQVIPKSKEGTTISSNEISLSEEKIWEQINATRMIVGYKAAPQSSCIEELKALYIFTGVEPPSSFDKSFDLREAEDKLHILMSIIGVK